MKVYSEMDLISANKILQKAKDPSDLISLSYDDRFKRRRKMKTQGGFDFLLNLPKAVELPVGGAIVLENGNEIEIFALHEKLYKVIPRDNVSLAKIAWHIGNRHMPCDIHESYLMMQENTVLGDMLRKLNCSVEEILAPFAPMTGAYGQGRTFSHNH